MRTILMILMLPMLAPAAAAQSSIRLPDGRVIFFKPDGGHIIGKSRTLYFLDSTRVQFDPIDRSLLKESDMALIQTITNKDSIDLLNLKPFDTIVFMYTKAWMARSPIQKLIPSTNQLYQLVNTWYYKNQLYTGKVVDYYTDGTIRHRGNIEKGRRVGIHYHYREDGTEEARQVFTHRGSREEELWYTPDKLLFQKVVRRNNLIILWEQFYENGAPHTRVFNVPDVKTVVVTWFSNGKLRDSLALDYKGVHYRTRRGNSIAYIKGLIDIGDYEQALEIDPEFPEIYATRASSLADSLHFDAALSDMDTVIKLEPYDCHFFGQRAFTRIRKYAQIGGYPPMEEKNVLGFLATKPQLDIPEDELKKIHKDLFKAHTLPGFTDGGYYQAYQLLTGTIQ